MIGARSQQALELLECLAQDGAPISQCLLSLRLPHKFCLMSGCLDQILCFPPDETNHRLREAGRDLG
jgi:hypothetical protein